MRRLLSIIVSLVTAISFAQQPVELPLWPDGAPNSSGLTGEEQETRPHFVTNVTHPTLTVYHPEKPNGMARLHPDDAHLPRRAGFRLRLSGLETGRAGAGVEPEGDWEIGRAHV